MLLLNILRGENCERGEGAVGGREGGTSSEGVREEMESLDF